MHTPLKKIEFTFKNMHFYIHSCQAEIQMHRPLAKIKSKNVF
jgi:hypothetical protein